VAGAEYTGPIDRLVRNFCRDDTIGQQGKLERAIGEGRGNGVRSGVIGHGQESAEEGKGERS
jgi:hypothetical protein